MLSYSRINTWRECPGALGLYLDKHTETVPEITYSGKIFHAAAEAYAKHCFAAGRATDFTVIPELVDRAYHAVTMKVVAEGHSAPTPESHEDALQVAQSWAERHMFNWESHASVSFEEEIAITREGTMTGWTSPDAWFRAILDWVCIVSEPGQPTYAVVIDYKAGWKTQADPLQFAIYAWLVFLLMPDVQEVHCEFHFVRFGFVREKTFTREEFDSLDYRIRDICAKVEEFMARHKAGNVALTDYRPGLQCGTCSRSLHCPRKAVPLNGVASAAEAEQCVENIHLLERDLKAAKAGLRVWTDINGPVAHNGVEWGNHVTVSQKFDDVTAFIRSATEIGENPYQFLSVNMTKAGKLKKKLPQILVESRSVAFTGKAQKEADE